MFKIILLITIFLILIKLLLINTSYIERFNNIDTRIIKFVDKNKYKYAFRINPIPPCSVNGEFGDTWRVIFKDNTTKDICLPVKNKTFNGINQSANKNSNKSSNKNIDKTSMKPTYKCKYKERYLDGCCPSVSSPNGCCADGITSKIDLAGSNCSPLCEENQKINGCCPSYMTGHNSTTGCCLDGITPKNDKGGSNCRENIVKNLTKTKILQLESPDELVLSEKCYEYPNKNNLYSNENIVFFQENCSKLFPGSKYYAPHISDCSSIGQSKIICSI